MHNIKRKNIVDVDFVLVLSPVKVEQCYSTRSDNDYSSERLVACMACLCN